MIKYNLVLAKQTLKKRKKTRKRNYKIEWKTKKMKKHEKLYGMTTFRVQYSRDFLASLPSISFPFFLFSCSIYFTYFTFLFPFFFVFHLFINLFYLFYFSFPIFFSCSIYLFIYFTYFTFLFPFFFLFLRVCLASTRLYILS